MGPPPPLQTPTLSSHFYSQSVQLKLYQAFIFSVPILFTVILLLMFYFFYLKRRRDSTRTSSPASLLPLSYELTLKKEQIKEALPIITFDEKVRNKESQCCVCLGDFELKEQLHQIPPCQHVFHIDCIHHWLEANFTCPLCRCTVISTRKQNSEMPIQLETLQQSQ